MKLLLISILCFLVLGIGCERTTMTSDEDDGLPPAVPANLRVYYATDGEIGIEWDRVNDASLRGYYVYRSVNDTLNFVQVDNTSSNYFEEHYLEYDSTYYYRVTAFDKYDRESNPSLIVSAKPQNNFSPSPPNRLTINARNWDEDFSIRLTWYSPYSTDIAGYELYRSEEANFEPTPGNYVGFSSGNIYRDTLSLRLMTEYFYKIRSVDRGNLTSRFTSEISDIIFERPDLIYPDDSVETDYFAAFQVQTISSPANYKLIVQREGLFDPVTEKSFSSNVINDTISIEYNSYFIEPYKKYYWKVATYTKSSEPNSISETRSFIIIPE